MAEKSLPEWTTEMDEEILKLLTTGFVMTPTGIADNIGRSRGAVTRRLNTLEAGGLVEKISRGKYQITDEANEKIGIRWVKQEVSEEAQRQAAKEEYERKKRIEEELGISLEEYHKQIKQEHDRLESEEPEREPSPSPDAPNPDRVRWEKAAEIVERRHRNDKES